MGVEVAGAFNGVASTPAFGILLPFEGPTVADVVAVLDLVESRNGVCEEDANLGRVHKVWPADIGTSLSGTDWRAWSRATLEHTSQGASCVVATSS